MRLNCILSLVVLYNPKIFQLTETDSTGYLKGNILKYVAGYGDFGPLRKAQFKKDFIYRVMMTLCCFDMN